MHVYLCTVTCIIGFYRFSMFLCEVFRHHYCSFSVLCPSFVFSSPAPPWRAVSFPISLNSSRVYCFLSQAHCPPLPGQWFPFNFLVSVVAPGYEFTYDNRKLGASIEGKEEGPGCLTQHDLI